MKTLSPSVIVLSILLLPLCLSASAPQQLYCSGCEGDHTGQSTSGTGASAGETVSITITSLDGICSSLSTPHGDYCKSSSCLAEVTRSWSGLVPDSKIKMCTITPQDNRKCADDGPTAGPQGSGSDTETPTPIPCEDELPPYRFTIESSLGTISEGTASCSGCKPNAEDM